MSTPERPPTISREEIHACAVSELRFQRIREQLRRADDRVKAGTVCQPN